MKSSLISRWVIEAGYRNYIGNLWHRWSNSWNNQIHQPSTRVKKKACAEWKTDYRKHSLEYGEIIHDTWLNSIRLASCQYRNGILECNQAIEPTVGLAMTHLVLGYPEVWKLYRRAVAESTESCNSITKLIDSFEEKATSTIDIETTEYRLQKRSIGFTPKKCDEFHYYVDLHTFEAIFESVQEIIANKSPQEMTTEHGGFNIAGSLCEYYSLNWRARGLGAGTKKETIELEARIKKLINDSDIRKLVEEYNKQSENLQNSELKKSYREAIEGIWRGIDKNGAMLEAAGSCEKSIPECRPRPPDCK